MMISVHILQQIINYQKQIKDFSTSSDNFGGIPYNNSYILLLQMRNKSSVCNCRIFLLTIILLFDAVYLIINISNLSTEDNRMERIRNGFYCREVCEPYPYQLYTNTCYQYDWKSSESIDKYTCQSNELFKHQDAYNTIKGWVIACSVVLLLTICWLRSACIKNNSRNGQVNQQNGPIILNRQSLINRSDQEQSIEDKRLKIEEKYQSFLYQDNDNTCCICLEQFKGQKTILLKCGHIFHSTCIKDWAAKQQNCPVCRASQ